MGIFGSKEQRLIGSLQVMGAYSEDTGEDFGRSGVIIQTSLQSLGCKGHPEAKAVLGATAVGLPSSV